MDDPSVKDRLIDIDSTKYDYDEVRDLPEESNNHPNQPSPTSNSNTADDKTGTVDGTIAVAGGTTPIFADQHPPALPPPKQKSLKSSKNKQKQKTGNKSKIPRSPSLASSLSSLASSFAGNHTCTTNSPPQTPPLPANYQQLNKSKHINGGSSGDNGATPVTACTLTAENNPKNNSGYVRNISDGAAQVNAPKNDISPGLGQRVSLNLTSGTSAPGDRRLQISVNPIVEPTMPATPNTASPKNFQYLTLTVRKDDNGYGMKVSGDNPVFVESVKPGGAAQIAGLVAGDMILKVNGQEVRLEKHPTVVSLIKASSIVELAIKRNHKLTRPTSVGIVPSTPVLSGRDRTASITGPQPVDSIKRREMETYKIQTLQKMLEQEKLNLDRLKGDTNNPSYKLSEANIHKLREQLRQVGAEDAPTVQYQSTSSNKSTAMLTSNQIQHLSTSATHNNQQHYHHNNHQQQASTPQSQSTHSSPAFLSLLPRSLSSLSLGTRKNKIDKDFITSPLNNTTEYLHQQRSQHLIMIPSTSDIASSMTQSIRKQGSSQNFQLNSQQKQQRLKETPSIKNKTKFTISKSLIEEDVPPPLPQRNPPRQLVLDVNCGNNSLNQCQLFAPISDLDRASSPQRNTLLTQLPQTKVHNNNKCDKTPLNTSKNSTKSKRSKPKTKALSDPKMSTQMFLQMEIVNGTVMTGDVIVTDGTNSLECVPPPLPPRQPGMLVEELSRGSCKNLSSGRAQPNSIGTVFNYPLVSTCTAVQTDNISVAFPLSQRPNIVQQLQQHHQKQVAGVSSGVLGQTSHLSQMKHRRVSSSPDNLHPRCSDRLGKTTSGSWELVEKEGEVTPPGTPPPPYLTSSQMSVPEDPNENCANNRERIFVDPNNINPIAGATSPVLHSRGIQAAQSIDTQKEIISMEDENSSDPEEPFIDENGPFNNLTRLLAAENIVFLAVFLNYVLSNSEPAPLLFYLITQLYKEGTSKDMRKWAYEIHSTFLVPRSPLSWFRQDESLAREVDNVLQSEFDKVEILRTVFLRSRKRAKDIISEQLREFQQKRTAGLGTIYGPADDKLAEAKGDKQRELIIDKYLMPKLQLLIEEYEKDLPLEDARKLALCSALSTVIHRIFNTRSHPNSIVDRVHHFVSREKSFKTRLMGKNRKMVIRGHPLVLRQYYEVTHCNHCQTIIWGVSPQGYHCTDCKLNIHRPCSKVLEENCPGPLPQAKRHLNNDNKISKFMGKIRPRTSDFITNEKRARQDEDIDMDIGNERLIISSIVRQPSDRRPDLNTPLRSNGNASVNNSAFISSDLQSSFSININANDSGNIGNCPMNEVDLTTNAGGTALTSSLIGAGLQSCANDSNAQDAIEPKDARRERYQQHSQHKSAPVSVNRSESYKERLSSKRSRNSRRKTSDPSLTSCPNDDQPDLGLSTSNYTASSNSSLSSAGGSESPSTSMEQVAAGITTSHVTTSNLNYPHLLIQQQHDSFHGSGGSASNSSFWNIGQQIQRQWNFESEDEDDLNEADWSSLVPVEKLSALTDAEKKRQEIINEIYQTERNHVRTLKLLDRLFLVPLHDSGLLSKEHLLLLFPPALLSLCELHSSFEQQLKQRRIENNHVVNLVGDLLVDMFDGQSGEVLREYAAQFCARQQIALEALKEKRHKDEQLQKLLKKSESHKACRRLELKDLLPTVLQRLTKYPLLFENLYKVTIRVVPENTTEAEAIQRALESSKEILVEVNKAVKTAEDAHKLQNIQRKLDKSSYDKDEFKKLDLTQHRLIHDGNLTMKKNPSVQLHGLLFENMIVLLTKQDDKYSLKNLHTPLVVNNKPVSPIMNIDSETLVRQEAADKNSFFLIKTRTSQMLELRAPSSSECKTWFKHISDAAAQQYKPRPKTGSHDTTMDDQCNTTIPHSNSKDTLELTPDRSQPMPETATIMTTPLAPLMPVITASSTNNNYDSRSQARNGRRDSTPSSLGDNGGYYNLSAKQRLSHDDLTTSINRTMSTRSCGESNINYNANEEDINGVALRHTQSAREANGNSSNEERMSTYGLVGGPSKRDSASIVYSNNSNNTRTLLMQSALVDPTAIQVSISPAHTAEPVLTPSERLRRLDAAVRDGLIEKQKLICDMFRLPFEHFNEIVDIAMMPEAPKDNADIALAVYDQVQTLTKLLNQCIDVTPEKEISAVSTAVCDHCYEKEKLRKVFISPPPLPPPSLPPPNKQSAQAQEQILKKLPKLETRNVDDVTIHEDDDGYCEIDELRLPTIPSKSTTITAPLRPFKITDLYNTETTTISDLSTISTANSTSDEVRDEMQKSVDVAESTTDKPSMGLSSKERTESDICAESQTHGVQENVSTLIDSNVDGTAASIESSELLSQELNSTQSWSEPQRKKSIATSTTNENESIVNEHIEINDVYDTVAVVKKSDTPLSMIDNSTQTTQQIVFLSSSCFKEESSQFSLINEHGSMCGSNRIHHASSLEPSVPCIALSNIVSLLNEQISLLLPKINERDIERDRLRKENQHLRELLSALHDRQRVDTIKETPTDITAIMHAADEEFEDDVESVFNTSMTPGPVSIEANKFNDGH